MGRPSDQLVGVMHLMAEDGIKVHGGVREMTAPIW